MRLLILFSVCYLNIFCGCKSIDLSITPLRLIDNHYKTNINGNVVNGIIQYFVVKGYINSKEADSVLFKYADSCRFSLLKENLQLYSAYFYLQTSATNKENIIKQGKYIDRYFESENLVYHVSCSELESNCFKHKFKNGRIVLEKGEKEVTIQDIKQ